jgi:hypothetical protein
VPPVCELLEYRLCLSAGQPDGSFNNARIPPTGSIVAEAAQAGGKIVISINKGDDEFAVRRLSSNGSLDTSFCAGGEFDFRPLAPIPIDSEGQVSPAHLF